MVRWAFRSVEMVFHRGGLLENEERFRQGKNRGLLGRCGSQMAEAAMLVVVGIVRGDFLV